MKLLLCLLCWLILFINYKAFGQCTFEYLSNDTIFQDYIVDIYPRATTDEIITIGSYQERGKVIEDGPYFQTFDYCGNSINKIVYKKIGKYKIRHGSILTHNTYKYEPIGNFSTQINEDEILLVDKAYDTISNQIVLILYLVDQNGKIFNYKTQNLNQFEANNIAIKHILKLRDGNILVIQWDYSSEYTFYYFNKNLDFLFKKSLFLGRGIRSIKETEEGDFICTSLAYDSLSFQFYKFDTNGQIKWIVNPYKIFGSASEVIVKNNRIYVTGGVSYGGQGQFGTFVVCDMNGNILKKFQFDQPSSEQRLRSVYIETDNSFTIAGYIFNPVDNRAEDVSIFNIDSNGTMRWIKLYNFKSALGTSGSRGYFPDYGGGGIARLNDGSLLTYGMSRYRDIKAGVIMHEDASLIKTEPLLISNIKTSNHTKNSFRLRSNPITNYIELIGSIEQVKLWSINNMQGQSLFRGNKWLKQNIEILVPGIYSLILIDNFNNRYILKFEKI